MIDNGAHKFGMPKPLIDGVECTDNQDGTRSFKTSQTSKLIESFKTAEDRDNLSDIQVLDAQRKAIEAFEKNVPNRLKTRTDLVDIQQNINAALKIVTKDLPEDAVRNAAQHPDINQSNNIGLLLAQKRVLVDVLTAFDQSASQTSTISEEVRLARAFASTKKQYDGWRDDVIGFKAINARKAINDMPMMNPDEERLNRDRAITVAQMCLAKTMDNIYSEKGAEGAKNSALKAIRERVLKLKTASSPAIAEELQIIIDYTLGRGFVTKAEIANEVPTNFLDAVNGGVASQRIKIESLTVPPSPESKERILQNAAEKVVYHPHVEFYGDQHGKFDKVSPDALACYVGDLLDIKESMYQMNPEYRQYIDQNFVTDLDSTMDAIEKDERIFNIGNHDMSLPLILMSVVEWQNAKKSTDKGKEADCAVLAKDSLVHWINHAGGDLVCKMLGIPLTGNFGTDIWVVAQNARLNRYAKLVINKGNLFTIPNEFAEMHTIPAADKDGNLLEIEDGLSGFEALSLLELRLRKGDLGTIKRLHDTEWEVERNGQPTGIIYEHGPLWRRGQETDVFYNPRSANPSDFGHLDNLISQLDQQAQKFGGRVRGLVVGHTSDAGKCDPQGRLVNIDHAQNPARDRVKKTDSTTKGTSSTFRHQDYMGKQITRAVGLQKSV